MSKAAKKRDSETLHELGLDDDEDEEDNNNEGEGGSSSSSGGKKEETASKKAKTTGKRVGSDLVFEIGNLRRCTVGKYKGKLLINIREFYKDKNTDEEKPGKSGIALTVEQWNTLKDMVDEIDAEVKAQNK